MNSRFTMKSPIGVLTIDGDDDAVTHIELPTGPAARAGGARRSSDTPAAVAACVEQLEQYFAGVRTKFDLPLEVSGTTFQEDVWFALADIPYGKTISYAELASMVGRPGAFRAVGQANGANPIPIVLPCHRVVASGGRLGGYGGGLDMKRRLLSIEGATWID